MTFREWIAQENIVRYIPLFKKCWNAATRAERERIVNLVNANTQTRGAAHVLETMIETSEKETR